MYKIRHFRKTVEFVSSLLSVFYFVNSFIYAYLLVFVAATEFSVHTFLEI